MTKPCKGGVGVGSDSRAGFNKSKLDKSEVDSGEVGDNEIEKKVQKLFKSKNLSKSKKTIRSDFFTPGAKLAFTEVRQVFVKAPILHHINPEHYIRIETNVSGYAIGGFLSQLTSDNLGRWYPVAFFFRKMIPVETRYKTPNGELLAIVEAFKTWKHYLETFQHELLIFIDYNNLRRFIKT